MKNEISKKQFNDITSIIFKNIYVLNNDDPETGECLEQWDCIKLGNCIDELYEYFKLLSIDNKNGGNK